MAKTGDQGQRYGVGDFRPDETTGWQQWIQDEECHGAKGASTDGRQGHHGA
ncbi:hypothetical protein D3C85_1880670 [compost metagenome]